MLKLELIRNCSYFLHMIILRTVKLARSHCFCTRNYMFLLKSFLGEKLLHKGQGSYLHKSSDEIIIKPLKYLILKLYR